MLKQFVLLPFPNEWLNSQKLEKLEPLRGDIKISASALEKLKELAAHAVAKPTERAIMKALEDLAAHVTADENLAHSDAHIDSAGADHANSPDQQDLQNDTCLMQAIPNTATNGSTRQPKSYKNPSLSPYVLIVTAIFENRRYMESPTHPKIIYVSEKTLEQLPKDIRYCIDEEFNGKTIPFSLFNGKTVYIPVAAMQSLPNDVVWCIN